MSELLFNKNHVAVHTMEPLTYLLTPEGPGVVIGTGDDSVEVGLLTSAKLDGQVLLCKKCVREIPVVQGGIRLMTCPFVSLAKMLSKVQCIRKHVRLHLTKFSRLCQAMGCFFNVLPRNVSA